MATPFPEKTAAMDAAVIEVIEGRMTCKQAAQEYNLHPRAIMNRRTKILAERSQHRVVTVNPALMMFGGAK